MRNQAPFDVWLDAVKDRVAELKLDFAELADTYSFREAYDFNWKPNETVNDAALEMLLYR